MGNVSVRLLKHLHFASEAPYTSWKCALQHTVFGNSLFLISPNFSASCFFLPFKQVESNKPSFWQKSGYTDKYAILTFQAASPETGANSELIKSLY